MELIKFLIREMPQKSRDNIKTLLKNKQILVDGVIVTQFNELLEKGQWVTVSGDRIEMEKSLRGISILFEDQYLIVIDKHAGTLSISTENEKKQPCHGC